MCDKEISKIKKEIEHFKPKTLEELNKFRIKFLGKKSGIITNILKNIHEIPIYKRKIIGKIVNDLKKDIKKKIYENKFNINNNINNVDLTITGNSPNIGSAHPISIIKNRIIHILSQIGFNYINSPEIEDDWHNFTALNIPIWHPSRDMQDTFFLCNNSNFLLRTHTTSIQIRYMKKHKPPSRIFSIGKVYRNETVSSHSNFMFHQMEAFYIDKYVSFSNLKKTINYIILSIFGKSIIRFRPSYFPFTEPSAEVDVYYNNNWMEIMGCGIIDPIVLKNVDIDPEFYSGFAFGLGIERLALMIYKIKDIRTYFDNDIRFLNQFKGEF
ncbi:phenylalanine--tRNA ligase subunit alpha [Blattabacterium cuenoti]|uniref:phenylalanine--tRNA ligase subunit alpha n=1 Tax=Blattabacterium cuenoti TaxID=1653831 RepID=UPI00163C9C8F|nr:phenylalanine--tRNA ligase subunit alpha [Blattabacterium cuenoti]